MSAASSGSEGIATSPALICGGQGTVLHPEATQTRTRRRLWLGRLRHQSTEGVGTERIAHVEAGGLNSGGLSTYL
jgi:hypothetical protein